MGSLWNHQATRTLTLREAMDAHMERVFAECNGNISETARRLGVERSTVQRWMKRRAVDQ